MKNTKKMQRLLEQMARIERMERGTLCRMGGRPYYNHQRWCKGRNVVRYVSAQEVDFLRDAINGCNRFMDLAERYAEEVIKQTRIQRQKIFSEKSKKKKSIRKTAQNSELHNNPPFATI